MAKPTGSVEEQLRAALSEHQAGRLDEAAAIYRRVIATRPEAHVAHHNLGLIHHAQGRLAEAIDEIGKAVEVNPGSAAYLANLASVLQADGKAEEAVRIAGHALKLEPDLAAAHNTLGLALVELGREDESEASFRRALAIAPRYPEALANLARLQLLRDRVTEAVELAESAIRLRPSYAKAYLVFGSALMAQERPTGAAQSYKRAIELGLDTAEANIGLGQALSQSGDATGARLHLARAVDLAPEDWSTHSALGHFLQHHGELDLAAESLRAALTLNPAPELRSSLAHTVSHKSADDGDVVALRGAYEMSSAGSAERMHLAFGLGKAFEDLKVYGTAFDYAAEGNAVRRATFDYATRHDVDQFRGIRDVFSTGFLQTNAGKGDASNQPLFIVGMPRSGTTLTEQILSSHPDVFGAGELKFLAAASTLALGFSVARDPERLTAPGQHWDYAAIGNTYLSWLPKAASAHRFVTDKMPQNFILAGLIHLVFPNAKIVHVRRSPLDNCLSIFKNHFAADGLHFAYDLTELGRYYNLYRGLMRHWHAVMPGVIHDVQYEDLVSESEATSRALLEYCGLDWRPEVLDFHLNKREIKTASYAQVRRPIYKDSVNLSARYGERLQPLIDALAEWDGDAA